MPSDVRAELIEGIVYMPSPARFPHPKAQENAVAWIWTYRQSTPGTESGDNATVILGKNCEPQPDVLLMISPDNGGSATVNQNGYVEGPPELIVEIASSTEAYDLHSKKRDYEKHGVQEYVVIALRQKKAYWFSREGEKYVDLPAGEDGIYRSHAFPGLWLDPQAVLEDNGSRLMKVLQQGLASDEHAEFVQRLAATKQP